MIVCARGSVGPTHSVDHSKAKLLTFSRMPSGLWPVHASGQGSRIPRSSVRSHSDLTIPRSGSSPSVSPPAGRASPRTSSERELYPLLKEVSLYRSDTVIDARTSVCAGPREADKAAR